jgi:hypothetical protein
MEFPLFPPLVSHLANPQPPGVYAARFAVRRNPWPTTSLKALPPLKKRTVFPERSLHRHGKQLSRKKLPVDSGTGAPVTIRSAHVSPVRPHRAFVTPPPFLVRIAAYVPEAEDSRETERVESGMRAISTRTRGRLNHPDESFVTARGPANQRGGIGSDSFCEG